MRMRSCFPSLVALAGALVSTAHAQDGRLVDQRDFAPDDTVIARLRTASPQTLATIERVRMREITYLSDGLRVKGFLLTPKAPGRHPVLVFNRGGCKNYGALTRNWVAEWVTPFVDWGYVVVASQYRGNGGSEGRDQFGGDDVNDVLNLLPLIDALPEADASRIGMWGESRGGVMTFLALTRTDRIRAAITVGSPGDLSTLAAYRKVLQPKDDFEEFCLRDAIPGYDAEPARVLAARSAIRWPEKLSATTPILLFQGTSDWRSDPRQPLDLAAALLRLRRPFRLVMFEGGDHVLTAYLKEVDRIGRDWLDHYVRDRKPWPSLTPHGH